MLPAFSATHLACLLTITNSLTTKVSLMLCGDLVSLLLLLERIVLRKALPRTFLVLLISLFH